MRQYNLPLFTCGLVFCVALAGCTGPQIAADQPIYDGIFTQTPPKSPFTKVQGGPNANVAVILSKNTVATIDNLKKTQDFMAEESASEKGSVLMDLSSGFDAFAEASDPEFPVKWIAASLRKKFGTVKLVQSISALQPGNYTAVVIVDFYRNFSNGFGSYTYSVRVRTPFYDNNLKYIGEAVSNRADVLSHYTGMLGAQDLVKMAQDQHGVVVQTFQQWDASLDKIVDTPTAVPDKKPDVDRCVESALLVKNPALKARAIEACNK